MNDSQSALDELEENFDYLDDWTERYQYLIDLGRKMPDLQDAERVDDNKVRGCLSQVWLVTEVGDGSVPAVSFRGDSDSAIVKGLVAVLRIIYSGQPADVILKTDIRGVFDRLGLASHLSPNRRNGFVSMTEVIRNTAAQSLLG